MFCICVNLRGQSCVRFPCEDAGPRAVEDAAAEPADDPREPLQPGSEEDSDVEVVSLDDEDEVLEKKDEVSEGGLGMVVDDGVADEMIDESGHGTGQSQMPPPDSQLLFESHLDMIIPEQEAIESEGAKPSSSAGMDVKNQTLVRAPVFEIDDDNMSEAEEFTPEDKAKPYVEDMTDGLDKVAELKALVVKLRQEKAALTHGCI